MGHEVRKPDSPLPAHLGVELYICPPPYAGVNVCSLVGGRTEPPLGSVMYATGQSVLAVLDQLAMAIWKWPWVAPCAGLAPTEYVAQKYASLDRLLGSRLAVVHVQAGQPVTPAGVAGAVAMRNPPHASSLVGWTCTRLDDPSLASPLMAQFAYALRERADLPRSVSWYSRTFAEHGSLRAKDWRVAARLVVEHHLEVRRRLSGRRGGGRPDEFSLSSGTARRYSVKYLGRVWSSAIQYVGWEWVLESILRKHNYPSGR